MGLDRIVNKIKQDAEQQADQILTAAKAQAEEILASAQAQADEIAAQSLTQARELAALEGERTLTLSRLEQRKLELSARQRVIAQAFLRALSDLEAMPVEEYMALLVDIVGAEARGGEEIILNPRDRERIGSALIDRLNKSGPGGFTLSDRTRDISGGVVLSRGRIEVNLSLDTALAQIREELEIEVARLLFGGEGTA